MLTILFTSLIIAIVAYWVYCLGTYDWNNFDKDQKQAMEDLF
jgi:hypothetical protein